MRWNAGLRYRRDESATTRRTGLGICSRPRQLPCKWQGHAGTVVNRSCGSLFGTLTGLGDARPNIALAILVNGTQGTKLASGWTEIGEHGNH
jgi:hypothetical protein